MKARRPTVALCLEYPLKLHGGVSVLVSELLDGLERHFDLVLVSPDEPESVAGLAILRHIRWNPRESSRAASRGLADELKTTGVDLAHFHFGGNYGWGSRSPGTCPIPYVARAGIAVCSTVHLVVSLLDGYCGPQKPLWFKLALLPVAWAGKASVLHAVRAEVAVSQHDLRKLQHWYFPFRSRFRQIYHSRIHPTPPAPPLERRKIILNAGHIARRKGQPVLAEAFTRIAPHHPEWELWLVGDALEQSAEQTIRDMARGHGLEDRIRLPGSRDDVFKLMREAAIYVQPSFWEALGLALQEAMFCGCACVGSRAGGIPELIEHEKTGLLFEPGNSAELGHRLEQLIGARDLRDQLAAAARDSILSRGMTAGQMIESHLQLYRHMLA